jgi:excisionase family DNA binding protein
MNEKLLDIQALATYLDCCTATAYKMVKNDVIKGARVGNRYRITKSAVDAFLRSGVSGGDGEQGQSERAAAQ